METIKNLLVFVYRHGADCTNGGVTSKVDATYMFVDCEHLDALDYCVKNKLNPELCLILVRRTLFGKSADYVAPLVKRDGGTYMSGGNFVYSHDSRFKDYTGSTQPIAVHDRFETWSENEMMSR